MLLRLFRGRSNRNISRTSSAKGSGQDWRWERADEYKYEHYTEAVDDIKQLKSEKRHREVIDLLQWCIEFTEAEAEADGPVSDVPAPAYYRHLSIVLRKEDRYDDEVAVLEQYVNWFEDRDQEPRNELVERLERARELASSE